jgi:hypothetical protein
VQQQQQQEQQQAQLLEICPSQTRGTTVALSKMPPHWKTKKIQDNPNLINHSSSSKNILFVAVPFVCCVQ